MLVVGAKLFGQASSATNESSQLIQSIFPKIDTSDLDKRISETKANIEELKESDTEGSEKLLETQIKGLEELEKQREDAAKKNVQRE